jgi:hypothetical protein
MWNSLSTCYQKLQVALQAGFIMPLKTDRDFFEASTGCIVEDIRNEPAIEIALARGVPVITNWELVNVTGSAAFGGAYLGLSEGQNRLISMNLTIKNGDAMSAYDSDFRFCKESGNAELTHVGGDVYNTLLSVTSGAHSLIMEMNLGYLDNEWSGTCNLFAVNGNLNKTAEPSLLVHYDPADFKETGEFAEFLAFWGW